jgi:hypothetical protein
MTPVRRHGEDPTKWLDDILGQLDQGLGYFGEMLGVS